MADPDLNLQSNGTANGSVASISAPVKLGFSLSSKPKSTSTSTASPSFSLLKDNASNSSSRTSSPGLKRPHSLLDEDATSHHDHAAETTSTISTFGAGVANGEKKEVKPERIIQGAPNKDWREEARRKRQRSGIPGQGNGANNVPAGGDVVNREGPAYGLTVTSRTPASAQSTSDTPVPAVETEEQPSAPQPQSADDAALAALLDPTSGTAHTTIRAASPLDEDDAFRSDFRSAPRMATLDEYTATPVEGFGAAILRGYLKPGETLEGRTGLGKDVKAGEGKSKVNGLPRKDGPPGAAPSREQRRDGTGAPVRRPGLLGLGAKSEAGAGVELGAWGKGARAGGKGSGAKGGAEIAYMPVAMRNRKTGEVVSEEEMRKMIDGQNLVEAGRGNGNGNGSREGERSGRKMIEAVGTEGRDGRHGEDRRRDDRDEDSEEEERRRRRRKEKEKEARRRDDEAKDEKSHRRDRDVKGSETQRSDRSRRHDGLDVDDYSRRDRRRDKSRDGDDRRSDRRDGDRRHRERDGGSRGERDRDRDRDSRHDDYRDRDRHEHRSSRR